MKRVSFVFLLTVLLFAGCGGKNGTSSQQDGKPSGTGGVRIYSGSNLDVTFEYPNGWTIDEKENRVGVFSPDDQAAVLLSQFFNIPGDEKVQDIYENVVVRPYSEADSFQIGGNQLDEAKCYIDPSDAGFYNAEEGYTGVFMGQISGTKIEMTITVLKKGTAAYQILSYSSASSGDKYRSVLSEIAKSVKIPD
ncbi:MAG: hypothetical protein A2Y33_02850 [Spirochaetes bacterium GWF1_51_8]|nr:MAG: hypothetical protein A2Y33_02850 [Spirochaetes bacterium GWF1_51_8]